MLSFTDEGQLYANFAYCDITVRHFFKRLVERQDF